MELENIHIFEQKKVRYKNLSFEEDSHNSVKSLKRIRYV